MRFASFSRLPFRGGGDPWWRQSVAAAATTVGESEFWVLILEEGKERLSFGFKGRRSKVLRDRYRVL